MTRCAGAPLYHCTRACFCSLALVLARLLLSQSTSHEVYLKSRSIPSLPEYVEKRDRVPAGRLFDARERSIKSQG